MRKYWYCALLLLIVSFINFNEGKYIVDLYSLIYSKFFPTDYLNKSIYENRIDVSNNLKLKLLEKDNIRLRRLLSLNSSDKYIGASTIARSSTGWWDQIIVNKGTKDGVKKGSAVLVSGSLVGVVKDVNHRSSKILLLTSLGSQIGVWIESLNKHALLVGKGTSNLELILLERNYDIDQGDLISTSPASTLLPPNLPVGIINSIDKNTVPEPKAKVSLFAEPFAIDWVQILR